MHSGALPSPTALRELVEHGDARDRAYVDAMIRMGWARTTGRAIRDDLEELATALRAESLRAHERVRAAIRTGTLRGAALRTMFDDAPARERDHFVEEV